MIDAWLIAAGATGAVLGASLVSLRRRPQPLALDVAASQSVSTGGAEAEASRLLARIVDSLAAPIAVVDRGFSIRHANAAAHALLGDAAGAVLRHPALRAAAATLSAASVTEIEIPLDVPVQRRLRASLMRLPEPFARDGLLGVVLDDRTQNLALDRMRADFVANASHELRTPLAALIGFIDTLRGPAADDPVAQQRFLEIMSGQAQRMRRLIDNLMSLSRVQLTEHERPRGVADAGLLAERVAAELRPLFATRNQHLSLDIHKGLPQVAADTDQIAQVIGNLLDNASKYSPAGAHVCLSVEAAPSASVSLDEPLWSALPGVVISVADDGPGIAEQHIPRLTERFYRVDESHAGRSGSGLGLAIVKHIIGRHRGKLAIESTPGEGSIFRVWLPAAAADAVRGSQKYP
jgi:two-component system, OmpR family, phosphate regulon sensor histidine kinase PhoR